MTLIKTSLLNGIAVIIKLLTMLGLNKIIAIYLGPSGYAVIGNFQNAIQIITTFGSGAINNGIVKYTAEYDKDHAAQIRIWRAAGAVCLVGSIFTALTVSLFSKQIAYWFLGDSGYNHVFLWFAFGLVFFMYNTLFLAVINGKKEFKRYVIANIAGSLFSLIVTSILAVNYGITGALIAIAVYPALSFVVTYYLCHRAIWFKITYFFGRVDVQDVKRLGQFALMALVTAACVPLTHILIRSHLTEALGLEAAGYWEAMWRLSGAYLMLVTTTLSLYYLPRLSEIKHSSELKAEILQGYKILLPIAALSALIIYSLRDLIIVGLFTQEFSPMRDLFAWQMIGDTLKIGSWILAYVMISKAMTKLYIVTEVAFAGFFYFLIELLVARFDLDGAAIAHAINYFIYWIVMSFCLIRRFNCGDASSAKEHDNPRYLTRETPKQ